MIFIGIICVVFLFCFFRWVKEGDSAMFLFMFPTTMVCSMITFLAPPIKTPIEPYVLNIVNMKQNIAQSMGGGGSFLCWSMNSEQELQYLIMVDVGDGRMKRVSLNQEEVYVVETDDHPRVEFPQEKWSYSKWVHFPSFWGDEDEYYDTKGATIFVPKGTVAIKFEEL